MEIDNCRDDIADNGVVKDEIVAVPNCAEDVVCPIVMEPPALAADESPQQQSTRRRSARTVRKRSLLLPGELENNSSNRIPKQCQTVPCSESVGDNMENGDEDSDDITVTKVVEAKKKRTYSHRRKPQEHSARNKPSAASQSSSESVNQLLGQLVSSYCGDDGHPANCKDCKNRLKMIRALLETSGKCGGAEHTTNFSFSTLSQEAGNSLTAPVGPPFSCATCPDQFDSVAELLKHEKITHSVGRKQCPVCRRYLAANTSVVVVSKLLYCFYCSILQKCV